MMFKAYLQLKIDSICEKWSKCNILLTSTHLTTGKYFRVIDTVNRSDFAIMDHSMK